MPLSIIDLCQSADSYSRIKNSWSLAFATFIENIVHIFLVIQLDMIFGVINNTFSENIYHEYTVITLPQVMFVFFVNGATMMYFSYWLLKNLPNVVSIHPITVAIVARYPFKNAQESHTIHI